MKNGSDIQPEDSFFTLPVFPRLNKSAQGSSVIFCVAAEGGIYHPQIKARPSAPFALTHGLQFMGSGGVVPPTVARSTAESKKPPQHNN